MSEVYEVPDYIKIYESDNTIRMKLYGPSLTVLFEGVRKYAFEGIEPDFSDDVTLDLLWDQKSPVVDSNVRYSVEHRKLPIDDKAVPDSISFYKSFSDVFDLLNERQAQRLWTAIFDYAFRREDTDFSGDRELQIAWTLMKPNVYESMRLSVVGKSGGRGNKKDDDTPKKAPKKASKKAPKKGAEKEPTKHPIKGAFEDVEPWDAEDEDEPERESERGLLRGVESPQESKCNSYTLLSTPTPIPIPVPNEGEAPFDWEEKTGGLDDSTRLKLFAEASKVAFFRGMSQDEARAVVWNAYEDGGIEAVMGLHAAVPPNVDPETGEVLEEDPIPF